MYKLYKGESYHGHELEKMLNTSISSLVVENYNAFLSEHKADIEAQLRAQVAASVDVAAAVEQILCQELEKQGLKHVRNHAANAFVSGCQAAFHAQLAQTTGASVSHAVTTTVGTTVGASIMHALAVAVAHAVGAALIKLAHSVAFKAMLKDSHPALGRRHRHGRAGQDSGVAFRGRVARRRDRPARLGRRRGVHFLESCYHSGHAGREAGQCAGRAHARGVPAVDRKGAGEVPGACAGSGKDARGRVKAGIDSFLPNNLSEVADSPSPPPAYEDVEKDVMKLVDYDEKGVKKLQIKSLWQWVS